MNSNLYAQMLDTASRAGIKVVSDDDCAKLLAWLYCYGGSNEAVIYNMKLRCDILEAQKRFNISGGETPKNIFLLKKYLSEVEPIMKRESKNHPSWAYDVCKKYGLKENCIQ